MTWVLVIIGLWGGQPFTVQIPMQNEGYCILAKEQFGADNGASTLPELSDPKGIKFNMSCLATADAPDKDAKR
jgi:hypothetical protein